MITLAKTINIIGLQEIPLIKQGDNLPKIIVETMKKEKVPIDDGDIIVVAQKIVSKAEGRTVKLRDIIPSEKAKKIASQTLKDPRLVELIIRETKEIVKATSEIFIVENKEGIICINAGIDKSNVSGNDAYTLLPEHSDKSARGLLSEITKLTGKKVSVIICDTFSRPFRRGQVGFTIGIAGVSPFIDYRGQKDLFDYTLKVKNTAVTDEIASAAELVMGQGKEAIPVAIIKNLNRTKWTKETSTKDLLIPKQEDLFKETL
jgi:coenzyme F420-0:L-glutamate ligase/coenzyme F420-1:gamma-L-glutamate ligase